MEGEEKREYDYYMIIKRQTFCTFNGGTMATVKAIATRALDQVPPDSTSLSADKAGSPLDHLGIQGTLATQLR